MWQWPAADAREVVDLAGAGTLAAGVEEPYLGEELRRWRGIVARRRLVALARRHAAVALGIAVPLEILALLGAFPQWVVVAAALAYFVVAVAAFAARGPSPFGLARLLDDKLGLNDRLATALEIEAHGGAETPLERRTVADAAALLRAGREDWRARPARVGRRDWSALVGVVAALAVVVAIGAATGGGSTSRSTEALAPKGGGGAGAGPNEHHKKRAEKGSKKQAAPTGKLHKFEGEKPKASSEEAAEAGYQKIPQGTRSGKEGKAAAAKGAGKGNGPQNAPTGKLKKGANSNTHGGNEEAGKKSSSHTPGEKEHPTVGFNVKSKKHGNNGKRGASKVSGAGGNKAAPNGKGDEGTAGESTKKNGSPSGSSHAGGEQGTSRQGHAKPITGKASQAVKIQPGYAPSRSTKGGKERNKAGDEEGAGGKARTAQVTGATQVGDEFSFVPAAGGAVPGPSAGLQLNYLESLKWVERLPW